uniref:ATP synthase complex subunit 8 n=1 Tax=Gammarus roeselii TaxID=1080772 RepID=A0A343VUL3_9CRUS|nr:ATP synthase F0 subunit 8 [Gammarus roeselii]AVP50035.1 ATP synthase F0 subunit 8 [Gammarus roeselii]
MPQMAPILSTYIFYTIIITLVLLSSIIYFSNSMPPSNSQSSKNLTKTLTWMW